MFSVLEISLTGAFPKVSHSIQVEEHNPSNLEPHNPGYALVGQAT